MPKLNFTPLYAQIKTSILSRIAAREWGPGSFLPSEMALAAEYGVSQGTLRKALNDLTQEKRLVRFQGKGTAVAVLDTDGILFRFFHLWDDKGNRLCPLSQTDSIQHGAASAEEAGELSIGAGSEVIRIHRIRILDEEPVINEVIVLPAARFPDFTLDFSKLPNTLYEHYYQQFGIFIVQATETIKAVLADAQDRKCLRLKSARPLLEVRRQAFNVDGSVVEFRRSRIDTRHRHYRVELR